MRIRSTFSTVFLLTLALSASVTDIRAAETGSQNGTQDGAQDKTQRSAAQPRDPEDPYAARFQELDRDKDGSVSRSEWPLDPKSFEVVDRDKNGLLSRKELLTPNVNLRDRDRDGRLDALEKLERRTETLQRQDLNREGYIPRTGLRSRITPRDHGLFRDLDRNHDNRLSRMEWTGSRNVFVRLDRNRDGFVELNELVR